MRPKLTIGMAVYDDFSGVYFTVQSLRLYHKEVMSHVELLVVDNNPESAEGERTGRFIRDIDGDVASARYLPFGESHGTSAPRDKVFREASAEAVLCLDSHVLVAAGGIARLLEWYDDNPESADLLTGPLIYDDLRLRSTHFADCWRAEMWGTWATDPRADPADAAYTGEPFEIPAMGLGLFSCRRDAWLGFNPAFRGFGGEEFYIHEKYRRAGRRNLCLPWLVWLHRFGRPAGVRYPLERLHRIRNYILGHTELGLPLDRVHEHFVGGGFIDQAQWEHLTSDPLDPPEQWPATSRAPSPFAITTATSREDLYEVAAKRPSDINEHVPKLRELASRCDHVTELGMRYGVSTVALLCGQPRVLRSYDLQRHPIADQLKLRQGDCDFSFVEGDSLAVEIENTDLLLIDTRHTAQQLRQELSRHFHKVRRWIVLHDTHAYGAIGEDGGPGLLQAVREWLREHPDWAEVYRADHNNGLMVLERAQDGGAQSVARPAWKASCVCPTFGRPPQYQHLLEEAIASFLLQDYAGEKELIVLNDCPGQTLVCNAPGVRIVNRPTRIATLGEKYNAMIELATGDVIFPWEDDDVSLPWRIRQGIEQLEALRATARNQPMPGVGEYWKPPQVWFAQAGQAPVWRHAVGVRHHAGVFTKDAWRRLGGYPHSSGAQDAAFDAALGGADLPIYPEGLPAREWAYVYRWGVQPHHLSSVAPHDEHFRRVGELAHARGEFLLTPGWREDYVATTRLVLAQQAPVTLPFSAPS